MGSVMKEDIMQYQGNEQELLQSSQTNWNLDFISKMNIKALAFTVKLLEIKYSLQ